MDPFLFEVFEQSVIGRAILAPALSRVYVLTLGYQYPVNNASTNDDSKPFWAIGCSVTSAPSSL
jgi:hypothetical protein